MRSLLMLASLVTLGAYADRVDIIDLPTGFSPEGITNGDGWTAYVGSLINGSIWKGDLYTGVGEVVLENAGGAAAGLEHDRRSGYLYVCGGGTGTARIYNDETWELVVEYTLADAEEGTFINDVILTKTAAYFTDSVNAQLYTVALNRDDGGLADGPYHPASTIQLTNFTIGDGFNANGIEATDDGSMLIVANTQSGLLYAIDPETGVASVIDLDGEYVYGDGLVLRKNTLWVVENGSITGNQQISEVSLSSNLSCGSVAPRVLVSDDFDVPTTATRKGNSLYAVQAKFGVPTEERATTAYEIVRVDRDEGEYVCPGRR